VCVCVWGLQWHFHAPSTTTTVTTTKSSHNGAEAL